MLDHVKLATMPEARMFAALSATNEAILRSESQDDLFQRVCDAAVHGGGFKSAGAFLAGEDGWLGMVAATTRDGERPIADLKISIDANSARGQGLAGTAFRSGRSCVSNDYQNDERVRPWRDENRGEGIGAAAAVPILREGNSIGVFMFVLSEAGSLTEQIVGLIERMVENVSFALSNIQRDEQRRQAERASRRATDMFAALSATNTAILRAHNVEEMFQLVCESVAKGGKSLGTAAIFLAQPGSSILKLAAAAGEGLDTLRALELSTDPDHPHGQGLAGPAFREQKLMIAYNLAADDRTKARADRKRSPYGGAAVPLVVGGVSVGILYFFFGRTSGRNDEGIVQLMRDIAENVSFGMEGFQRDAQKERISRMFAALSATNEAIMRATSRAELFQMVCDAAVQGAKFTSTTILLEEPASDLFQLAATAGPNADIVRSRSYSPREDRPEGHGLVGTAFRTGKAVVQNNLAIDTAAIRSPDESSTNRSAEAGACLPLFSRGRIVGVLLFMAAEADTFTPEFIELLQRLADNVSFALGNFDRADEKKEAEERIKYLATHDGLTGLPNRVMFNQLLEQSIKVSQRNACKSAVLFIDLDRFKVINDSLGHAAGDTLLIEVARRLRGTVRDSDTVARLGGDEFVVILNDIESREQVGTVARKLLSSLVPALDLAGHECRTTGSIGIAIYPDNGSDAHTLTKNADIAMYVAKEEGKNDFRFFSADIKSQSIERLMLETNLRNAIELGQLSLHYQPKVSVTTGEINGVEALLRWMHPDLGNLSPMKFIPLAEETGLIIPIGRWVLKTACAQNMAWQRGGMPPVSVAINLSARQFQDDNLLQDIDDVLKETGMPPHLLQLEITESMVMQNVERGIKLLDAIQGRGVRLAIDDFGTGYSSMSMMKKFPIDTIKIDRSFVRDLAGNSEDRAITTAIISMGKALGLTVIAEGVETTEQDAFLRGRSCDELQGYLFSKPIPAGDIPALFSPLVDSPPLQRIDEIEPASACALVEAA